MSNQKHSPNQSVQKTEKQKTKKHTKIVFGRKKS